jgi:nucleoside recognition membrane protein YjiH
MAESRSRSVWISLALAALVGVAAFFVPAFIIRPFTHQSARGLLVAMAIRQRAPLVSLVCALICLILVAALWQTSRIWRRAGLSAIMVIVTFAAVMSRLNYFEWMFHPVDAAQFETESASKLDKGEMILTVRFGADARAYPIREMAYHHILNDVVGGVPVAVTY